MVKKPLRVRYGSRTYGIAAANLVELTAKFAETVEVDAGRLGKPRIDDECMTILDDGDYFQALPENTRIFFDPMLEVKRSLKRRASMEPPFLDDPRIRELVIARRGDDKMRSGFTRVDFDQMMAEHLEKHKEWFPEEERRKSQYSRCKTKSEVMEKSAESRIRSYLSEAVKWIDNENLTARQKKRFNEMRKHWFDLLKTRDNWFRNYFSRMNFRRCITFCDKHAGSFRCEGRYNHDDGCRVDHKINPYNSRDDRLYFSMWNLDHVIEKKRSVLPFLLRLLRDHEDLWADNWVRWSDELYALLFTRANLRLVDIPCHDKSAHVGHGVDVTKFIPEIVPKKRSKLDR